MMISGRSGEAPSAARASAASQLSGRRPARMSAARGASDASTAATKIKLGLAVLRVLKAGKIYNGFSFVLFPGLNLRGVELVADAAYGADELGVLGVALDLLAQVRDVDVAGALVAVELGLPELVHDLAAGEDLSGAADQEAEQLELGAGEADRLAAPPRTHGAGGGARGRA